ncbi:unnamed protein product [Nyctereutes procyonoides]|uniref:(raccoon dog) hypothetical protein n=1 Tax=Nyctereutes procyonoides TaxID=34880 RepID=A0A811ZPH7_NYCPR|nr:unnamed protein product [Nyctereutes procyonoides]
MVTLTQEKEPVVGGAYPMSGSLLSGQPASPFSLLQPFPDCYAVCPLTESFQSTRPVLFDVL